MSHDLTRYWVKLGAGTLGAWVSTVGGEKVVLLINSAKTVDGRLVSH